MIDLDHIDPRWEEGRNYQLICGLSTPDNLIERDSATNTRKSNRFLPYKGIAPVNEGDFTCFLSNDGEWVYESFMGEWWYEQTRSLCGPGQPATETQKKAVSLAQKGKIVNQFSRNLMSQSHTGMKKPWVTDTNKREYTCPNCGKIIRSKGNLTQHVKAKHETPDQI